MMTAWYTIKEEEDKEKRERKGSKLEGGRQRTAVRKGKGRNTELRGGREEENAKETKGKIENKMDRGGGGKGW